LRRKEIPGEQGTVPERGRGFSDEAQPIEYGAEIEESLTDDL